MEKDIRAHVLRVALEELNQCGPAFHMDDLARRLHISKRTLYENFSSKQEIVKNAILSIILQRPFPNTVQHRFRL